MERKRKKEKKLIERKKLLRLKRRTKIKGNNEVPVDLKSHAIRHLEQEQIVLERSAGLNLDPKI